MQHHTYFNTFLHSQRTMQGPNRKMLIQFRYSLIKSQQLRIIKSTFCFLNLHSTCNLDAKR